MDWQKVKLGEILLRRRDTIKVMPDEEYKLVTIKLYHKGVTLRSKVKGLDVKSSMSKIKSGDFILSGIDARNGAFGIVPEELDGAIVTNDFWCLDPDENRLNKEFLLFLTTTNFFDNICKQSSDGTTQRIRLQKDKFFNFSIFLPSVDDQIILTKQFKKLEYERFALKKEFQYQLSLVKQLRRAFLSEAMQGKLCQSEHPEKSGKVVEDQETGQQLLARIKAEKAQLIKDRKLKKEKELPPIKPEEIPFEIPKDWVWCRLGEVTIIKGGKRVPIGYSLTRTPTDHIYLRVSDMKNGSIDDGDLHYIDEEVYQQIKQYTISENDIYMTIVGGTIGKCGLITSRFNNMNLTENAAKVIPLIIDKNYLLQCLQSPFCQNQFIDKTKQVGVQKMALNRFSNSLLPLPPLSVQNQIVAKLHELMKTCDDLENSIKQSQLQNEQLLQQVLKETLEIREEEIA